MLARWASTCQTVGMNTGYFASFTLFLALNDTSFCNRQVALHSLAAVSCTQHLSPALMLLVQRSALDCWQALCSQDLKLRCKTKDAHLLWPACRR